MEDIKEDYTFSMSAKEAELCKVFEDMCIRMEEFEFRNKHGNKAFTPKSHFNYSFGYAGGLGTYVHVVEVNSGRGINLTDYDSW